MSKNFWFHDPEALPNLLHSLGEQIFNNTNRFMKRFSVTVEQAVILFTIWDNDGINQKRLAELVYKDQANVTRILKRLINKGWLEIKATPTDKRYNLVYMTPEGNSFMEKLYKVTHKVADYTNELYDQEVTERLKKAIIDYNKVVKANDEKVQAFLDSVDID